mmetsp:Transcript_56513/g.155357  ORF Transcript_56513/g.155357 Transcript_56513/m.155357 type:complete len:171 (-) Transcript_56513:96-608(-)
MALEWADARRARDYATADGLRAKLRSAGHEPEELVFELETGALWIDDDVPTSASAVPCGPAVPAATEPDPDDPLAYRVTAASGRGERGEYNPSPHVANHKDGGTGGLLTISYTDVQKLPANIGFSVCSQKWVATAEPLIALKKMQEEEEERKRQEIAQSNRLWRIGQTKG